MNVPTSKAVAIEALIIITHTVKSVALKGKAVLFSLHRPHPCVIKLYVGWKKEDFLPLIPQFPCSLLADLPYHAFQPFRIECLVNHSYAISSSIFFS